MALRRPQHAPPAGRPRQYGDIDPSDEVHDEIRHVAAAARQQIVQSRMPQDEQQLLEGVRQYGLAPGAKKLMDSEMKSALWSEEFGTYVTFRSSNGTDCTRVGPHSHCFCRHSLADHDIGKRRAPCKNCPCGLFQFFPKRPEECGFGHLPRRKGFVLSQWSPPCQCKHRAHEHEGHGRLRCRECRHCPGYVSDWCCVSCDKKWEEHETVFESERERMQAGRPVREAYRPLSDVNPEFSELVYGKRNSEGVYELPAQTEYQRRIKPEHGAHIGGGGSAPGRRSVPEIAGPPPAAAAPAGVAVCGECKAEFSSAGAKFCRMCGAPRKRPSHPFEVD